MEISEVALTSEDNGQSSNIFVWNYQAETILKSFKGSSSAPHTLSMLGHDYILSAQKEKPLIHVWNTLGKENIYMKHICPGRVNALCVTPDSLYCIAGIEERLFIWHISTGDLLAVISKHYQRITCIRTTSDGSYFLSAGEDNLVHVWQLNRVLSEDIDIIDGVLSSVTPIQTWGQHSLPVTDIHVGFGCLQSRVATCSLDQSCKLYDMLTGKLLLSIVFDCGLSSVIMDPAEYHLMTAATDGRIFRVNLFNPSKTSEIHYADETPHIFEGHSKPINCLAVSQDGTLLLSGSVDTTAKLWHIPSCQCIRTFHHKGSVSNVMFAPAYEIFFTTLPLKPEVCISMFQRNLRKNLFHTVSENREKEPTKILMKITGNFQKLLYPSPFPKYYFTEKEDDDTVDWKSIANKLRETNRQMYDYTVQHILQNPNQ